jgi:prephenate dehydratase
MKKQKLKKVAIQGIQGSFHEIAAKEYFGKEKIDIVCCYTFKDVFTALNKQTADIGVIAIENSVVGSILPNYTLLRESGISICGEIFLRIKQNLMVLPCQKIHDIKEVHSHTMAIQQCEKFFLQYPHIKLVASADTALCAKNISEEKLMGVGAIGSMLAARMYNMEIIGESIETNKRNFTRFLVIANKKTENSSGKNNKSSLCFSLPHEKGSLSKVLSVLAHYNINLTKIQSMPIIGKEWKYMFYADLIFNNYKKYQQSINSIRPISNNLQILGEYRKGKKSGKEFI